MILLVEDDQSVHLTAEADAGNLFAINSLCQMLHALQRFPVPILRFLLGPAGVREIQRIFTAYNVFNISVGVHQQKLYRGCSEVNAYIIHIFPPKA